MIRRISSGGPYEDKVGYSRAVAIGPWVLVSGCTSTVDGEVRHEGDPYWQALTAFEVALAAIEDAGASRHDVVRTRMYVTDTAYCEAVGRAHAALFAPIRPAATMVQVAGLIDPRMLVEVEVEAYREEQP